MQLASNGSTDYQIVLSGQASPSERYAAEELQRVRVARLPIQYVEIVQHRIPDDDLHDMAERFFRVAEGAGIAEIREGTPLREFSKDIWTLHTTQDRYTSRKGFQ